MAVLDQITSSERALEKAHGDKLKSGVGMAYPASPYIEEAEWWSLCGGNGCVPGLRGDSVPVRRLSGEDRSVFSNASRGGSPANSFKAKVTVRFLADEDLDSDIIDGLRSREPAIDILDVKKADLRGKPDAVLLDLAAQQDRILITHDRRTA